MCYPAHIRITSHGTKNLIDVQTVQDHCRHTAQYASAALKGIGLGDAGYLAGLVHDCGKFKKEFSDYLYAQIQGQNVKKGSVNHTFAGCRLLLELFHSDQPCQYEDLTAELLAYAVGAHHGLFDCIDEKGNSGFLHRLQMEKIGYEEATKNFFEQCASRTELEDLFQKAHGELLPVYEKESRDPEQQMFCISQLARLILSAVIEGDRRDTAEFMDQISYQARETDEKFWADHLRQMEEKLAGFRRDTPINVARGQISDLCRMAADREPGVYRLHVPTGGGKTLSSLRFAMAHAAKWNKKRIIFVTPLLTILEQNAAVIRSFAGDDSIILEHHSNVLSNNETPETLDLRELAVNSWEAPIIITTLVQLLNTLFLGKTTSIRRYQALCNAVVVIDEVQTVPNHMLSLFNTALNFLSDVCGTTFLLCSATQPCFEEAEHRLCFMEHPDLIAYQKTLWEPFRRTDIQDAGAFRLEEIPEFIDSILQQTQSLLIICNKKSEAEFLFQHLSSDRADCYHLSSAMCMSHRRKVLESICNGLEAHHKIVCVSTQVMEAGVDISFSCVIRLTAGMDSVVQAAGRCNRNGENDKPAPVFILQCTDENLNYLREIREGKEATVALLNQFRRHPEQFDCDLSSDQAVKWYYRHLFQEQPETYQQYTIKELGTLYDLLSWNDAFTNGEDEDPGQFLLHQAFKTAGCQFQVMDDSTEDVLVPYGEGQKLIRELEQLPQDLSDLRTWEQKAKPYTVSVYQYQKKKLGLRAVRGVLVLEPEYYSEQTGLQFFDGKTFLEV